MAWRGRTCVRSLCSTQDGSEYYGLYVFFGCCFGITVITIWSKFIFYGWVDVQRSNSIQFFLSKKLSSVTKCSIKNASKKTQCVVVKKGNNGLSTLPVPLRIIHVVAPAFGYTFSGTTKHTLRLLREWPVPQISITIWGTNYFQQPIEKRQLWSKTVRHTRRVRLLWAARLLWMLIRDRRQYDLVHVHVLWWGGLLTPLVARLLGKKAIYQMTLLGSDNPSSVAAQSLGGLKLALFRKFNGVIGLTPALVDDCSQLSFRSKLLVLPGFLVFDPPKSPDEVRRQLTRRHWGIPDTATVLLFVGSIIPRKGVHVLVDVFVRLASQRPNLWLLMVGARTQKENPRMDEGFVYTQRDKLRQAGLSDRVIWTGLINDETELKDSYLSSDLFVFPTQAEGQGYVILEAMGCGLPVVCSHLPGVTDVMVMPDETGYLVDVDKLDEFIAATAKLLDDPALRDKMGKAGNKRAITEFGFQAYCHQLADFYRRVAADKSN